MAMLTPITGVGNIKYHVCDTYANLILQKPGQHSSLCRLNDGSWYEFRQFDDDMGNGTWQAYTGPSFVLATGTGTVTESNPLPIKTSLLSATPVVIYSAISATPATPYTLVLEDTGIKEIKIVTSGTSTSRTMTFKAKLNSDDTFKPFWGINHSNATTMVATSTTGIDEIWSFGSLDGVYSLEFNVSAIGGGNLTVKMLQLT